MYGLPLHVEALPPMPEDGGHWSALHSWVMPTPSFVEFVMFSRYDIATMRSDLNPQRELYGLFIFNFSIIHWITQDVC